MTSHRYEAIIQLVGAREAACGATKVVAVDGPSGSGKTELVAHLRQLLGADVLHLEDLYPGWSGLDATPLIVTRLLEAIAIDNVGTAPRWDWEVDRPGALLHVPPTRLLILDGVGSGASTIRPLLSALIWVEAPEDLRKARALARDGETYAPFWEIWAQQETRHFRVEQTRHHADLIVST